MSKIHVLFLVAIAACLLEKSATTNFFYQANLSPQGLQVYPYLPPAAMMWQPDCDKSASSDESDESSSSEEGGGSSSESESGEESSSSSESEESGSKESKESKESGENGESGSSESNSSEEESGSKESSESSESSEEEKKEAPKKKKETTYLFPPRASYAFPARQMQQIIYSPASPYEYMPYRTSYVVQQPVASYPAKSSYQYIPAVPAPSTVVKGYPSSPVVNKVLSSPVQRIIYTTSSALNYPAVPKTVISPGARVYTIRI